MTIPFAVNDVCCVALELSKSTWVCAFAPPENGRASVHKMSARDVDRLISVLDWAGAGYAGCVSFARDRALLRSRIRRILARSLAYGPRHSHDCIRPGKLSQTAPG